MNKQTLNQKGLRFQTKHVSVCAQWKWNGFCWELEGAGGTRRNL